MKNKTLLAVSDVEKDTIFTFSVAETCEFFASYSSSDAVSAYHNLCIDQYERIEDGTKNGIILG